MNELIQHFPLQLEEALHIAKATSFSLKGKHYNAVLVSGLGGSGIGASILQDFVYDKINIPFVVNKTYHLPKFVDKHTLFIACSYSGNTEETLAAYEEARKRKATIVCVASGGELIERAKKHKQLFVQIPSGNPPRASLGYSLVQLIFILSKAGLIASQEKEIRSAIALLQKQTKSIQSAAHKLTQKLQGKYLAVYTTVGHEGLAVRFRQQLNENAKILAWHNVIPEMTHNEIVGWKHNNESVFVLHVYHPEDYTRNLDRLKFLKKVLAGYQANTADLVMKGGNYWEKVFYFIHFTDWVSVYLADLNQQDASEVRVIDGLKKTMSKK